MNLTDGTKRKIQEIEDESVKIFGRSKCEFRVDRSGEKVSENLSGG